MMAREAETQRPSEIELASEKRLHEMRQEQLAMDRIGGGDEAVIRRIEGELARRGEEVGVA